MPSTNFDIITIGGGLGGASLAKVMAEHGAQVLVLESETKFKDRVRGEAMVSWGVNEAKELGIYSNLKDAGGWDVEFLEVSLGAGKPVRRQLRSTTTPSEPRFNFYHPDIQESLLQAASDAGAVIQRGARVRHLRLGDSRVVVATVAGVEKEFTARLVVGADGRYSRTRGWGGFPVSENPESTFCSGLLFQGMTAPNDTTHNFRIFDKSLNALLFPQRSGMVRAYLCYPMAWGEQLSADKDIRRFINWSVEAGTPEEYFEGAVPAGPLASFKSASTWVEHPYRDGVALIGDAAGATDPMWGQGLSLTLRDVRVLRDHLIGERDWGKSGHAYAEEHDRYFTVCNTVQAWHERLLVETGQEANSLRARVFQLWQLDPTRRLDTFASGPEHPIDETLRQRFFGEDL